MPTKSYVKDLLERYMAFSIKCEEEGYTDTGDMQELADELYYALKKSTFKAKG